MHRRTEDKRVGDVHDGGWLCSLHHLQSRVYEVVYKWFTRSEDKHVRVCSILTCTIAQMSKTKHAKMGGYFVMVKVNKITSRRRLFSINSDLTQGSRIRESGRHMVVANDLQNEPISKHEKTQNHTNAQTHMRTNEQTHKQTNAQTNIIINAHTITTPYKPETTYYLDCDYIPSIELSTLVSHSWNPALTVSFIFPGESSGPGHKYGSPRLRNHISK